MARALVEDCWFVEVLEFDQCAYLERDGEGYATCRQEGRRSFEIVWQLVGNNLTLTPSWGQAASAPITRIW